MKEAAYTERLLQDLKVWEDAGWISDVDRQNIQNSLPKDTETPTMPTWLITIGIILVGLAIIAFVADNWDGIPRGLKLIVLITTLMSAAIGAGLTRERNEHLSNALSAMAALVFAASIALIGQAYQLPGAPAPALCLAAFGAAFIGAANRTAAPSAVALVFGLISVSMLSVGLDGYWRSPVFWGIHGIFGMVIFNGLRIRSRVLLHMIILTGSVLIPLHAREISQFIFNDAIPIWSVFGYAGVGEVAFPELVWHLLIGLFWAGMGIYGAMRHEGGGGGGKTLVGYSAWFGLVAFMSSAGAFPLDKALLHFIPLLVLSIAVALFGKHKGYGVVTAAGVTYLICAVFAIFVDLSLALGTSATLFGVIGGGALIIGYYVNRSKRPSHTGDVDRE